MITYITQTNYNKYVENTFLDRYVHPIQLHDFLLDRYNHLVTKIGYSTLGLPIFRVRVGKGETKILAWTQMHGNESTATLAFLDFLNLYESDLSFKENFDTRYQLDIILMLNPDGAMIWNRENALGIDINRDYVEVQTPEMAIFKKIIQTEYYHLALNCHDQRSIFGNPTNDKPAALSVLAPTIDEEEGINNARKRAIQILGNAVLKLRLEAEGHITRFDDTYYPTALGDNLQKMGIPTILLETGVFAGDYQRMKVRKLFMMSLLSILKFADKETLENDYLYYEIPESTSKYRDVMINNINVISNGYISTIDISVQFEEVACELKKCIFYIPKIKEIGKLNHLKGWQEFNLSSKTFTYKDQVFVKGQEAKNLFDHLGIEVEVPYEM